MTAPVALTRIAQIALTVSDLERAVAFYQDALGLPLLFRAPPGLAFFDCGGTRLMLSRPEAGLTAGSGGTVLYFMVADIQAAHTALLGRGVKFVGEPHVIARMPDHDLWLAEFQDSEGNRAALMAEQRA